MTYKPPDQPGIVKIPMLDPCYIFDHNNIICLKPRSVRFWGCMNGWMLHTLFDRKDRFRMMNGWIILYDRTIAWLSTPSEKRGRRVQCRTDWEQSVIGWLNLSVWIGAKHDRTGSSKTEEMCTKVGKRTINWENPAVEERCHTKAINRPQQKALKSPKSPMHLLSGKWKGDCMLKGLFWGRSLHEI